MIEPKDRIRQSRAELLDALKQAGADVSRPNAIRCPFHDDKHPSAGVYQDDEGVWRFKCQTASCGLNLDVFDVRMRNTGETVESQLSALRKAEQPAVKPRRTFADFRALEAAYADLAQVYRYTNPATGNVDLIKLRIERPDGKTFRQAHQVGGGIIVEGAPAKPHPIYNRTRIASADQVVIVEGEKCVHALADIGIVATCAPGGGREHSAEECDWSPLAGKTVILWPDHDPVGDDGERTGHRHMREVAEQVKALAPACSIWWLNPDALKLGDKEDAYDFLARFEPAARADAISDALDTVVPMNGTSELRDYLQDVLAGKWRSVPFPFDALSKLTKALLPGTITMLVGEAGGTKSMLAVQCLWWWRRQSVPVAAYMLEDDRRFHMLRALAQIDGNQNLADADWVEQYPAEFEAALTRHQAEIDALMRTISDAPDHAPNHDQVLTWIRQRAEAGARIVVVDPVTAIDAGAKPWDADKSFMAKAKAILRKHGASLVLVSHPRTHNGKASTDDAAGGRAYGRFSQSMIWLKRFDPPARVTVEHFKTRQSCRDTADRALILAKTRNGRGQGMTLVYKFDKDSLRFDELGVLVKLEKNKDGDE